MTKNAKTSAICRHGVSEPSLVGNKAVVGGGGGGGGATFVFKVKLYLFIIRFNHEKT